MKVHTSRRVSLFQTFMVEFEVETLRKVEIYQTVKFTRLSLFEGFIELNHRRENVQFGTKL